MATRPRPSFDDAIPCPAGVFFPIRRPRADERLRGLILSPHVVGTWQHWIDDHTRACTDPREECAGCRCEYRRQWRGYLAVINRETTRVEIFELTADACRGHRGRLEGSPPGVRGFDCLVSRRGGSRRGAVQLELAHAPARVAELPAPPDVRAVVRAWLDAPFREITPPAPTDGVDKEDVIPFPNVG